MDDKKWLKESIDKLDAKVDKIDTRLDSVDVTLAKQEVQLREHIFRTEINEENIALLREQIKPIEKHVLLIDGGLKLIGVIATLVGIGEGIFKRYWITFQNKSFLFFKSIISINKSSTS